MGTYSSIKGGIGLCNDYINVTGGKVSIIGFFGDVIVDIALFAAKIYSSDSLILVVDLSKNKRLFLNVVGSICEQAVLNRRICYTCNTAYYINNRDNYDAVFIFSDTTDIPVEILNQIEIVYLGSSIQKYSLIMLDEMMRTLGTIPYNIVVRSTEKDADSTSLRSMFNIKIKQPDNVYYIPDNSNDSYGLIRFEFGTLELDQLSEPMSNVIRRICNQLKKMAGRGNTYIEGVSDVSRHWMM